MAFTLLTVCCQLLIFKLSIHFAAVIDPNVAFPPYVLFSPLYFSFSTLAFKSIQQILAAKFNLLTDTYTHSLTHTHTHTHIGISLYTCVGLTHMVKCQKGTFQCFGILFLHVMCRQLWTLHKFCSVLLLLYFFLTCCFFLVDCRCLVATTWLSSNISFLQ